MSGGCFDRLEGDRKTVLIGTRISFSSEKVILNFKFETPGGAYANFCWWSFEISLRSVGEFVL